jgi:hypothetical protein
MDRCYSKDPENVKKFPAHKWPNGVPPEIILRKYQKKFPQNEARNMVKASMQAQMQKQAPPAMQQQSANVAWTAPDIYSAVPASASTSTLAPPQRSPSPTLDLYAMARERSRYDFVQEPEILATTQQAMPARTADGGDKNELRYKWHIDSGASCHISKYLSHFTTLDTNPSLPCSVTYGDGNEVLASGVGTVRFVIESKEVLT